mmetsp:Transcript_28490/g.92345  ORF Transcript_28490/g.92345 Transcript_28490/m.92345 type:complete len:366 (-) Transcript_28490:33-1130(-)
MLRVPMTAHSAHDEDRDARRQRACADQQAQLVQLLLQRCPLGSLALLLLAACARRTVPAAALVKQRRDATHARFHPRFHDHRHRVPLRAGGGGEGHVHRGQLAVVAHAASRRLLGHVHRLAREQHLVHLETRRRDQPHIRGHHAACLQQQHVSAHQLCAGHVAPLAVPNHHARSLPHARQRLQCIAGRALAVRRHSGIEQDDDDDRHALDPLAQRQRRNAGGEEQHDDQGRELTQEQLPKRQFLFLLQLVGTISGQSRSGLDGRQPTGAVRPEGPHDPRELHVVPLVLFFEPALDLVCLLGVQRDLTLRFGAGAHPPLHRSLRCSIGHVLLVALLRSRQLLDQASMENSTRQGILVVMAESRHRE